MTDQAFLQVVENDSGLGNVSSTQYWVKENKKSIESQLEEHGAILFKDLSNIIICYINRNFRITSRSKDYNT